MRLAALLLVVVACGPKATSSGGTGTATSTSPPSPSSSGGTTSTTSSTGTTTVSGAQPAATGKSSYSCFSYVTGNFKTPPRHACMRTDDCGPYLEQAKSVGGIREVTGCANVPAVYCFHQVASKDEPEGLDVCQPTLDECKTARADVVKAKMSVDSDCGQR